MIDAVFDRFLARARVHKTTPRELREQEISFVIGNEAAEGGPLHRGTVTFSMPGTVPLLGTMVSAEKSPRLSTIPFNVEGSIRQFKLVRRLYKAYVSGTQLQITPQLIKEIHAAAGNSSSPYSGVFRSHEVEVRGSSLKPLPPQDLKNAVTDFCEHLNKRWVVDDALTLSALALWGLNWIHPFTDGNGRAARALSYLILNLKFEMWLPGTPTLPEQLNERRRDYFDALAAADFNVQNGVEPDLGKLRSLLKELLFRQIASLPAQSKREAAQLEDIIARRIKTLDQHTLIRVFGSAEVGFRVWSISDYLLVHVAPIESLMAAEALFEEANQPFPGLLAAPGEPAIVVLKPEQRGAIVRPRTFEVRNGAALWFAPNAAAIIECPTVFLHRAKEKLRWTIDGALYILRRGDELTDLWTNDTLDVLVARHVQGMG